VVMGKVMKVKRLKSSDSKKSAAVPKLKSKWEKPKKKYISSQPGIMKIKNVKKRSFDPIKANRGVVLLQNIPHGFYEDEMKKYFGQFGLVSRIRLARSERTGRSKGYAFIEFKVPEVAQIAAETMNNYIMFKHVLKTVYIPPDKQTHNYFRKDVKFSTDADGLRSFSSAKTEQIEKEIEKINQPRTDKQHAKILKRIKKSVDKQGKKYGIDLSSIMVKGNNISEEASSTSEEEQEETKIVEVKKKPNKKQPEAKTVEKKIVAKKEVKKLLPKNEDKKAVTKKKVKSLENETGKSLLGELLNSTFDTDTSDDDFKIDHSFNASDEGSSNEESLFDLMASKLTTAYDQKKPKAYTAIAEYSASESESEDESRQSLKISKSTTSNATNGSADKISVNSKKRVALKRKNKLNAGQKASAAQPAVETQIKKKKQNIFTTENIATTTDISTSEPETPITTMKNKTQKPPANAVTVLNKVTSSSESESASQIKKKKQKHPGDGGINVKPATSSLEQKVPTQKMKKKQGDGKVNLNATTSSSEPESQNKKQINKNKQKLSPGAAKLASSAEEPEDLNLKLKKKKKQIQANDLKITKKVISQPEPDTPIVPIVKKKKDKPAEPINLNFTASSSEPEAQNPKLKKKNNKSAADEKAVPIPTSISKPEAINAKNKKQKLIVPSVSTSKTNDNGKSKKDLKLKVKPNSNVSEADIVTGWTNLSETDGDEKANAKTKGNLKLKTIVRKNVGKKGSKPNKKDAKKVKLTPVDLLQLVPSNNIKQANQLKSKKKSK